MQLAGHQACRVALRAITQISLRSPPTSATHYSPWLRNGMLVGLSDTTSHATRPRQRKARLLLGVLRDRPDDVLPCAHDL